MAGDNSVHITLTVDDQLTPVLAQITNAVAGISTALKGLSAFKGFGGIGKGSQGALRVMGTVSGAADKLNKSFAAIAGKTGDLATIVSQMQELAKAAHDAADAHGKLGTAQGQVNNQQAATAPEEKKWHEKWAAAGPAITGGGAAIGAVGAWIITST